MGEYNILFRPFYLMLNNLFKTKYLQKKNSKFQKLNACQTLISQAFNYL